MNKFAFYDYILDAMADFVAIESNFYVLCVDDWITQYRTEIKTLLYKQNLKVVLLI